MYAIFPLQAQHGQIVGLISYFVYYLSAVCVLLLNCFADDSPAARVSLANEVCIIS